MSRSRRGALVLLALAGLLVGIEGCARRKVYGENASRIEAGRGEDVVVEVDANPTTGYSWVIGKQPDPSVVGFLRSGLERTESTAVGVGGRQHFVFRAVGSGTTTLRLDYRRAWEQGPPVKSATFTIVVR